MGQIFSAIADGAIKLIDAIAAIFLAFIRLSSDIFGELLKFSALIGNTVFKGLNGAIGLVFDLLRAPFLMLKWLRRVGTAEFDASEYKSFYNVLICHQQISGFQASSKPACKSVYKTDLAGFWAW